MVNDVVHPQMGIQPIISYPREAILGKTYLMTIDLSQATDVLGWPYDDEEYVVYCLLDTTPIFSNKPLGEPVIVLHRFGGTYGPAMFQLTASQEVIKGVIRVRLVNGWGMPITTVELSDLQVTREAIIQTKNSFDVFASHQLPSTGAETATFPRSSEQRLLGNTNEKLRRGVALVHGKDLGTGFFISNDGSLLTCFHVIGERETGELTDKPLSIVFNQKEYPVKCIFPSPDPKSLDFAILRLHDSKLPPEAIPLPLGRWDSRSSLGASRRFYTHGFRSLEFFAGLYAEGKIRGYAIKNNFRFLQLSSEVVGEEEIWQGMSGAPIYFEATDQVVGMLSTHLIKQQEETTLLAVSIETVAELFPLVKERLWEEELLQQFPHILSSQYFTSDSFMLFYESLPLPNRVRYDELGEDKPQALIEQLRNTKRVYDFINWIRIKRPDIPLSKLIELPPIHRINFVNREAELSEACGKYATPYILFLAPAGYGKTELLKAILQRHLRDNWLCIDLEIPEDILSTMDLVNRIFERAGYANLIPLPDSSSASTILATLLRQRVDEFGFSGVILLVDNIERLPKSEVGFFLNEFLSAMKSILYRVNLRIRLAGRYTESSWERSSEEFKLAVKPLTPFRFRYVEDIVHMLLPSLIEEPKLLAAHLMHMTGGHPGCVVQILEQTNPTQPVEEGLKARESVTDKIVLSAAYEIRDNISKPLLEVFDVLSVFRRYNYRLLQRIIDAGLIEGSADSLEKKLTATWLVNRRNGFIQDETVRRLLAIRLRREETERFLLFCTEARRIYKEDLITVTSRPEYIVLEVIYQALQLGYYQGDQTLAARKTLSEAFFAEDGILNSCLELLKDKPDTEDIKANLNTLLENNSDWEFIFAVNFFLRGRHYNNQPYEQLCSQVNLFFE